MPDIPMLPDVGLSRQPNADFDFFMGIWRCRHRYLVRRLAECHDWIEFDGSCAARRILGGWGNCDECHVDFPGDPYRGVSLRTWDPQKRYWSVYRLDSRSPGRISPPVSGRFDKGVGLFFGEDDWSGQPVRVRCVWSRIAPDSARWEQAFSVDRGRSWETNWYMDFRRV